MSTPTTPHPPELNLSLAGKRILLGVCGGVAAYKSAELARLLMQQGATVQVVMTASAQEFVTPLTFQALTGNPVITTQWPTSSADDTMPHIHQSREADAMIVAPATADFLARLVQGRCDDVLSLLCIARPIHQVPLWVAPAMNREMWAHPATQRNAAQLVADGAYLLGPGSGLQACGEVGLGRMLEPEDICAAVCAGLQPKCMTGQRVLITAGPTFEAIDPVRGITNRSSGKMGFALAQAAAEMGAEVTLISGPVPLSTPWGVRRLNVESALQMHSAVFQALQSGAGRDVFIASAAVADWRVKQAHEVKLKKTPSMPLPVLEWVENPDILAEVAQSDIRPRCVVGFAAETNDILQHAQEKLQRKKIDVILANHGPSAFGQDANQLCWIDADAIGQWQSGTKLSLARGVMAGIAQRLQTMKGAQ
jgi:phosphopantothenoylcysteine decarboxylase/phosphopantothenate--cysteine ligase